MDNTLNRKFWELVVTVDKITQNINCEDNLFEEKLNTISIELTAIEFIKEIGNGKKLLSENKYNFVFKGVSEYKIQMPSKLEFDTFNFDKEIILEKINSDNNFYEISFNNAYVSIKFIFIDFSNTVLSKREFIDPIEIK